MERFSDEFRKRARNPTALDGIEDASRKLDSLRRDQLFIPELVPEFRERGRLPFVPVKVMTLCQVAIRRALELSDSMIRDCNAFAYAPVWISSRSLFELATLIYDTVDRLRPILEGWEERAYYDFCDHLDKVLLGFKSEELMPKKDDGTPNVVVKAKNVLTMIDRLDKGRLKGVRAFYDTLSEVAHPNYLGMIARYQEVGDDKLTISFIDSPAREDAEPLHQPLDYAELALNMLADATIEYEESFLGFVNLCETNLPHPKGPSGAFDRRP